MSTLVHGKGYKGKPRAFESGELEFSEKVRLLTNRYGYRQVARYSGVHSAKVWRIVNLTGNALYSDYLKIMDRYGQELEGI